jgi:hypothetical protein
MGYNTHKVCGSSDALDSGQPKNSLPESPQLSPQASTSPYEPGGVIISFEKRRKEHLESLSVKERLTERLKTRFWPPRKPKKDRIEKLKARRIKNNRKYYLKRVGLPLTKWNKLCEAQNNKCAFCNTTPKNNLVVFRLPSTKEIICLVCTKCQATTFCTKEQREKRLKTIKKLIEKKEKQCNFSN